MLGIEAFDNWCRCLNLSEPARKVIESVRSGNPSHRVGGGKKNFCGRYPSRKMGRTIQFESHRQQVRQIALELHDKGVNLTSRTVSKFMTKPGVMIEKDAYAELKKVRRELGYEK